MTLRVDNITPNTQAVKTQPMEAKKDKKPYHDPLLEWPYRGLAFTNDIGAAVMDIAPSLGTALWVPALMYFGADIYDKYKSDERHYDPSSKRGLQQAVFQACASVILPIVVVHNGQKAASWIGGKTQKNGMSFQLQEDVDNFTVYHLKRRRLKKYENNIDGYKTEFNEHLKDYLLDKQNSRKTKNPLKILYRWIFSSKHGEKLDEAKLKKIEEYSNKNIDEMFAIRKNLLNDRKPEGFSQKLMKLFTTSKEEFKKDGKTIEGYVEDAVKVTLKQRQKDRLFNTKLKKTAGGFAALALSINFIDKFVENYVIKKVVEPGLNNLDNDNDGSIFNNFSLKNRG